MMERPIDDDRKTQMIGLAADLSISLRVWFGRLW